MISCLAGHLSPLLTDAFSVFDLNLETAQLLDEFKIAFVDPMLKIAIMQRGKHGAARFILVSAV